LEGWKRAILLEAVVCEERSDLITQIL